MPAPYGTITDLKTIKRRIDILIRFLQRGALTAGKTWTTALDTDINTVFTDISTATAISDLAADPALPIRFEVSTDSGIGD